MRQARGGAAPSGPPPGPIEAAGAFPAATLADAARLAVALARGEPTAGPPPAARDPLLAGARRAAGPPRGEPALRPRALQRRHAVPRGEADPGRGRRRGGRPHRDRAPPGHTVVDLGDDAFTVGRPHPMIDSGSQRAHRVPQARDPATAVVLLDVVLGYGAHPDPASELAGHRRARGRSRRPRRGFVASVCGTDGDPQDLARQDARSRRPGWGLAPSGAEAARLAAGWRPRRGRDGVEAARAMSDAGALFPGGIHAVNVSVAELSVAPGHGDGGAARLAPPAGGVASSGSSWRGSRLISTSDRRARRGGESAAVERLLGAPHLVASQAARSWSPEWRAHHPPRRAAHHVGADVRAHARRGHRRPPVRGQGGPAERPSGSPVGAVDFALPPPRRGRADGGARHAVDAGVVVENAAAGNRAFAP